MDDLQTRGPARLHQNLDARPVETIDGDPLLASEARTLARRYWLAGFFALPWLWATNVWLFWPDFRHGRDPVVKLYTRRSALWFAVYTCVLMPWMLAYWIGGPKLLGQGLYDALDVSNLDLAAAGLSAG